MSAHGIFYKKIRSKSSFYYVFCLACISIVIGNIISSQKYSQNLYGIMMEDDKSIMQYLKHIGGTPLFNLEIEAYKSAGKLNIVSLWTSIRNENEKKIKTLESSVVTYPYSPELYYNLYLLYSEKGDKIKARENLRLAQQIDPSLK